MNANQQNWASILQTVIDQPGTLSDCYSAFHSYSLGNQFAAMFQLKARGMNLTPIASYNAWKGKGRQVKKGEKALSLCMPLTCKKENKETGDIDVFNLFVWKNNWFSLEQTEGEEYANEIHIPAWDKDKALTELSITEGSFKMVDGNCQGYASGKSIAINPLAVLPHKTRFHELAHVVLGHTVEGTMSDSDRTPKDIREVEAECTAYLLCSLLNLPGLDESRGYIQNWIRSTSISDKSAQRIFGAANKILRAGQAKEVTE